MLKYSYPVNCVSVYSNNYGRYYGECWLLGIKIPYCTENWISVIIPSMNTCTKQVFSTKMQK